MDEMKNETTLISKEEDVGKVNGKESNTESFIESIVSNESLTLSNAGKINACNLLNEEGVPLSE